MSNRQAWFEANSTDTEGVAKVTINGDIGSHWWDGGDVTSDRFMNAINALGDLNEIQIDINSPGGCVSGGLTIANFLRNHSARVVVNVLGQASSIASVIAASADEVNMGLGAFMFVHKASTFARGNADQVQAMANDLKTIDQGIMDVYVARIGENRREEFQGYVNGPDGNGTLLSAELAVEIGLADSKMETQAAASISAISQYMDARARAEREAAAASGSEDDEPLTAAGALALVFDIDEEEAETDAEALAEKIIAFRESAEATIESLPVTAEFLNEHHPDIVAAIVAGVDVQAERDEAIEQERERIGKIMNVCATTDNYSAASKMISENWQAAKAVDYIMAIADGEHTDSNHSPEGGKTGVVDTKAIYARRNSTKRK